MLKQGINNKTDILSLLSGKGVGKGKGENSLETAVVNKLGEGLENQEEFLKALNKENQKINPEKLSENMKKLSEADLKGEGSGVKVTVPGENAEKAEAKKGLNILQDVESKLQELKGEGKKVVKVGGRPTDASLKPENLKAAGAQNKNPEDVAETRKSIFSVPKSHFQKSANSQKLMDQGNKQGQVEERLGFADLKASSKPAMMNRQSAAKMFAQSANDEAVLGSQVEKSPLGEGLRVKSNNIDMFGNAQLNTGKKSKQDLKAFQKSQASTDSNIIKMTSPKALLSKAKSQGMDNQNDPTLMENMVELETNNESGKNSQTLNMNLNSLQPQGKANQLASILGSASTSGTFQMSEGNMANLDTNQVIEKVSDYITQKSFANQKEIELSVSHKDLGDFLIRVAKQENAQANNALNIQITTANAEGKEFFTSNQGKLLSSLNASGLNIGDLKLESSGDFQNQFSQENSSSNGQKQGQSQQKQDSERRRQLWQQFNQQYERAA